MILELIWLHSTCWALWLSTSDAAFHLSMVRKVPELTPTEKNNESDYSAEGTLEIMCMFVAMIKTTVDVIVMSVLQQHTGVSRAPWSWTGSPKSSKSYC